MNTMLYILVGLLIVIAYSSFSAFLNWFDQKRRSKKHNSQVPLTKKEVLINILLNALYCTIILVVLFYFFKK